MPTTNSGTAGVAARLKASQAEAPRARVQAKVTAEVQTDLSNNPIAKIVLAPESQMKDADKVAALRLAITAETLPQLNELNMAFAQKRTARHKAALALASTTAFSRMQSCIGNLQGGVVDFDQKLTPMTEDLQAVFDLRVSGKTNQVVAEIKADREKEADWDKRHGRIDADSASINSDVKRLQNDIVRLQEEKGWFGGVKKSALQDIASKQLQLAGLEEDMAKLKAEYDVLLQEQKDHHEKTDEFKAQKDRMRKMLDLGPEYIAKMQAIVDDAVSFIDKSSDEVLGIRGEFDQLGTQSSNILKANNQMIKITAVLNKGIDGARELNVDEVKKLDVTVENEDDLDKITRQQKKNELERFVSALTDTSISTKKTVAALQEDAVGAENFAAVVVKQQQNLRELHGDGIASVATSLNMTLQAFNTAALTESSDNAWQAMADMNKVTNRIRDNEVVSAAMRIDDTTKRIVDKFDSLSGVSQALIEANKIRSDGLANINSTLADLAAKTDEVQKNLQVSIGLDAGAHNPEEAAPVKELSKTGDELLLM